MAARVKEFYRGYIIELTRGTDHWFVSAILREDDEAPLAASAEGARSFTQALAYAKLLIDSSVGASEP